MKILFALTCLFIIQSSAIAGSCGEGRIIQLSEGFYGDDTFAIVLDYSQAASTHPGTEYNGAIAFNQISLSEQRLNGIRALALEALRSNKILTTWSHNNDCGNATAVNLFR